VSIDTTNIYAETDLEVRAKHRQLVKAGICAEALRTEGRSLMLYSSRPKVVSASLVNRQTIDRQRLEELLTIVAVESQIGYRVNG
jgi:hypothetical protein